MPAGKEPLTEPMLLQECMYEMQSQLEQMRDQMLILSYYIMYDFIQIIQAGFKLEQLIIGGYEFEDLFKIYYTAI